ncbi:MAG: ketoacyl-ACP synthase III [Comamonas sp.]|nr:ketoacyl-ACP synthase III [Comamonas sp.]
MAIRSSIILGTGSYAPERILTNEEISRTLETSDEWIRSRSGIRERHIAAPDEATSDMGVQAARNALADAGLTPDDIDLLVVATVTPDMTLPACACIIQQKLGLPTHAACFDLNAACSGFIYGLDTASAMIQSGRYKKALVIGVDKLSAIVDWNDRNTCVLFGDGAGAVVLKASGTPGILASDLHADGQHVGLLCVPGHVSGGAVLGSPLLTMDGQAVFKLAVSVLEKTAHATLQKAGVTESAVDWLVPHQANIRIMQSTARRLHLPMDKVVVTVGEHGNTSAASIPLALDHAVRDGSIRPGQYVLIEGVGGGFTWGSMLVKM